MTVPKCKKCKSPLRLVATIPSDRAHGEMELVFQCTQCDEFVWIARPRDEI
jgi:hypothetical protein